MKNLLCNNFSQGLFILPAHFFFRNFQRQFLFLPYFPKKIQPKNGQQPLFQIPGASSHQQVDSITDRAFQIIPCHSIVRFQMADNGLNSCTPSALFALLISLVTRVSFKRFSRQHDFCSIHFVLFVVFSLGDTVDLRFMQ